MKIYIVSLCAIGEATLVEKAIVQPIVHSNRIMLAVDESTAETKALNRYTQKYPDYRCTVVATEVSIAHLEGLLKMIKTPIVLEK